MKMRISVIVPVYQVEKYLSRCIESLLAQSYSDYEIILVDDGSRDGSGQICDDYAGREARIRVIHQENQGLGPARNAGVRQASGDYVVFVDSDDYVAEDYLEYLAELVERYQVKLAVTGAALVWEKGGTKRVVSLACNKEERLSCVEALTEMCYGKKFGVSAWAKIYEKSLVEKYPYPACVHEDLATTYRMISECPAVAVGNRVGYYYVQREGSLMNQKLEERHLAGLTAAREELEYMRKYYPEAVPAAEFRCGLKIVEYIPRLLGGSRDDKAMFRRLRTEMRRHLWKILRNDRVEKFFRFRCLIICAGYEPTRCVWKSVHWLKQKKGKEGY